jgi:hypothetical protein
MMAFLPGTTQPAAIIQALVCVLCYQIGNLAPCPVRLSKPIIIGSGIMGTICFALNIFSPSHAIVLAARFSGTIFISLCIQSARSLMKGSSSKMLKRSSRVAGFALGFFCNPVLAPIVSVFALFFTIIAVRRSSTIKNSLILPRLNHINAVMIFHQMHYFVYCYAAFIIAFELGGRFAAAFAFLASWIIYVFSPLLYRKTKDLHKVFFFGHSLLVILFVSIYFVPSMSLKIILYLLTGVGGTTEFCIGGLAKKWDLYNDIAQGVSENIGHVFGVTFCLLVFIFGRSLQLTLLFAAVFALMAIACMTINLIKKEK